MKPTCGCFNLTANLGKSVRKREIVLHSHEQALRNNLRMMLECNGLKGYSGCPPTQQLFGFNGKHRGTNCVLDPLTVLQNTRSPAQKARGDQENTSRRTMVEILI